MKYNIHLWWQRAAMLTFWALTYLTVFSLPVLSTLAVVGSICVYTCSSILAWISFTFICVWKGKVKIQYEFIYTTNYKKNILSHKQKKALTLPFLYLLKSHIVIPFLQSLPIRPGLHWQTYEPGVLIQVPPYRQGFRLHSSTSVTKNILKKQCVSL